MNIVQCTSTTNTSSLPNRNIEYIVIHYTAGVSSAAGTAKNIARYFAKESVQASADFIVDDSTIVQFNPDIRNRYCWAVGGKKYTTASTSQGGKYYQIATNKNTVHIELCSNKTNRATLNASDHDWYITDATLRNGASLTKYLMEKYNIDINHVIMHHHVTGKICPNPFCVNEAALSKWNAFKQLVQNQNGQVSTPTPAIPSPTPQSTELYRVQLGAYGTKENADKLVNEAKEKGLEAAVIFHLGLYKVQAGAYSSRSNAEYQLERVRSLGFDASLIYR